MAAFDTTRPVYGSSVATYKFVTFIGQAIASVVAWNDARVTRNALASLTDRELDDIGLIRGDIDSVAQVTFIR